MANRKETYRRQRYLFLRYISDDTINDDSSQNIIVEYFNKYN